MTTAEMSPAQSDRLREIVKDPYLFSRAILGHSPWSKTRDIMRELTKPHAQVAVKACHSSGKTFTAAEVALWFLARYRDGRVVTTAPTFPQVKDMLWREIRANIQHSRIAFPEPNITELNIDNQRYALGRATNQGVRFQGYHGRWLIIIDEAPGVDDEIWKAIDGIRAGGDIRLLALGNPVIASGNFYEIFSKQKQDWKRFTISAFDTPNLAGLTIDDLLTMDEAELDRNERPYLTTRRWVRDKYLDWGPDSADYQSRVLGQFPKHSKAALISLDWIDAASERPVLPSTEGYIAGIDVAGPGKAETVVYVRQGPNVVAMEAWRKDDPLGDLVQWLADYEHDLICYVDEIGIGYNFAIRLREALEGRWQAKMAELKAIQDKTGKPVDYPEEPKVVGVNVGESPEDSERFLNLKAEAYWGIRDRFKDGDVRGLLDDETKAQLGSIRSIPNARGQNTIERKEDAAKRGVPSPDRAEAFMLCFSGQPRPRKIVFGSIEGRSTWSM